MQITPVSAAGQGEKAGPQASLSGDRSSKIVGDLATLEFKASRKKPPDIKILCIILDQCDERPQLLSDGRNNLAGQENRTGIDEVSFHSCNKDVSIFCLVCGI